MAMATPVALDTFFLHDARQAVRQVLLQRLRTDGPAFIRMFQPWIVTATARHACTLGEDVTAELPARNGHTPMVHGMALQDVKSGWDVDVLTSVFAVSVLPPGSVVIV
jgi:hypothetical protein